jgi:hypothetical protein
MRKLSLLLSSTVILALVGPAIGQHPPPGLMPNQNPLPPPPVDTSPRYRPQEPKRSQPNDNAVQDAQRRKQQQRSLNGTTGRQADPGKCAVGVSEETCRRRGQKVNPLTKH